MLRSPFVLGTLTLVGLVVMVPGEPIGNRSELIKAVAAVIVALTGMIAVAFRYRR